jgi:hypothetical protein
MRASLWFMVLREMSDVMERRRARWRSRKTFGQCKASAAGAGQQETGQGQPQADTTRHRVIKLE